MVDVVTLKLITPFVGNVKIAFWNQFDSDSTAFFFFPHYHQPNQRMMSLPDFVDLSIESRNDNFHWT